MEAKVQLLYTAGGRLLIAIAVDRTAQVLATVCGLARLLGLRGIQAEESHLLAVHLVKPCTSCLTLHISECFK